MTHTPKYNTKATELGEQLRDLLKSVWRLNKRDARSFANLLADIQRYAYEGAEIDAPLDHEWCLTDTEVTGPLLISLCENSDIETPDVQGLRF